jgi:DNA polymerase III delta subunit
MIYLLYGSDTTKSREKLHELVGSLLKKKPDASYVRLTDETFEEASLDEHIGGMGLFSQKTIVELDNVFRNKEAKPVVIDRLKDIAESDNIFVVLEGELTAGDVKKFEKYAEKVQEFTEPHSAEASRGKDFNIFSLTDVFGKRDRKQLWVLYTKAKRKNISAEEIHGILFWQVKAMFQAQSASSAKEASLNPFVYQKSQGFLRNFKAEELKTISSKLVSMYHDARRGIRDFDLALEKFILEM